MSEEETRKRTSAILGHPVSDSAWSEAWEKAKRKIRHIAEFCGYDGCREQPGYMAQIAAEMGLSLRAAEGRLYRLRKFLQKELGGELL